MHNGGQFIGCDDLASLLSMQKGKLPGIKIGRIWRFRREDTEAWLDRNMSVPKPAGESAATGERGN